MPSSRRHRPLLAGLGLLAFLTASAPAWAQPAPGFLVERLDPSAAGAGWFVADALDMHGALGGALAFHLGVAHDPLRISDGTTSLAVVQDQAFATFAAALTWHQFRASLDFAQPVWSKGQSGTVAGQEVVGPQVDLSSHPDWVSDVRLGFDARLWGGPSDRLRLGASLRLYVPNGSPQLYDSDGTFRAQARVLAAGEVGHFVWAGHAGLHVRPLDLSPLPWGPRGHELVFALAGGARFGAGAEDEGWALVVGPELFGATPLRSAFDAQATALEALLGARVERRADDATQVRVRLGGGVGLDPHLGAPQWRAVLSVEVSGHTASVQR